MESALEVWFRREILPYEPALVRFLGRKSSSPADVDDIRHDIYIRILEAAETSLPVSPRSFLFAIARNVLVDRTRRARIVSIDLLGDMDDLHVLIDEICPERNLTGHQQLQQLSGLFDRLPARCREIVWMRRVEDLPQKEIARRLGISESTVEKHLIRGISLLANALYQSEERADTIAARPAGQPGLILNE